MHKIIASIKAKNKNPVGPLRYDEALRALLCMLPMMVAIFAGQSAYVVALGQGGFFVSSLFLPARLRGRFVMGAILIGIGLGFYLIGGTVASYPLMAIFFTFLIGFNLSFLSSWKIGGPLALTFIMIYTSGLNTGSAAKASQNFFVFAFVMLWSMAISMLPIWKGTPVPPVNDKMSDEDYAEQGVRMGVGSSLALGISYLFGFAKLGWAPSAAGNIIRYDPKLSRKRAWARAFGTIGGALLALVTMLITLNPNILAVMALAFGVLNGLFKMRVLGQMPLFYTATILVLYSLNDLGNRVIITERVLFNIVGIIVAMCVVIYPFPRLMRMLRGQPKTV